MKRHAATITKLDSDGMYCLSVCMDGYLVTPDTKSEFKTLEEAVKASLCFMSECVEMRDWKSNSSGGQRQWIVYR